LLLRNDCGVVELCRDFGRRTLYTQTPDVPPFRVAAVPMFLPRLGLLAAYLRGFDPPSRPIRLPDARPSVTGASALPLKKILLRPIAHFPGCGIAGRTLVCVRCSKRSRCDDDGPLCRGKGDRCLLSPDCHPPCSTLRARKTGPSERTLWLWRWGASRPKDWPPMLLSRYFLPVLRETPRQAGSASGRMGLGASQ